MQKIQVLFPDPMMQRVREAARREDVPVSEIIRKALTLWLDRQPNQETPTKHVPVINAGRCLLNADAMKEALHE